MKTYEVQMHRSTHSWPRIVGVRWSPSCPGRFIIREIAIIIHWIGGWASPRTSLNELKRENPQHLGSPACSQSITTVLSWLQEGKCKPCEQGHFVSVEAQIQTQGIPCGICCGQSWTRARFSLCSLCSSWCFYYQSCNVWVQYKSVIRGWNKNPIWGHSNKAKSDPTSRIKIKAKQELFQPWRWGKHIPLKHQWHSCDIHSIIFQKAIIFENEFIYHSKIKVPCA
jgi:hypothetical protein